MRRKTSPNPIVVSREVFFPQTGLQLPHKKNTRKDREEKTARTLLPLLIHHDHWLWQACFTVVTGITIGVVRLRGFLEPVLSCTGVVSRHGDTKEDT